MGIKRKYELKEKPKRVCPNNWEDCEDCLHERACASGIYKGEEDILAIAARISEKVVTTEAKESAEKIRGTWAEWFMKLSPEESMDWFYSNKAHGLHHKEPIPQDGPSSPGGSKSGKVKKSKRGNKVSVEPWTAIV